MQLLLKQYYDFLFKVYSIFDRNEVWRYNTKFWGNRRTRLLNVMFTGIQWGLPLAIATIAYEEYFDVYNKHSHGHGHGDDASAGHH